MKNSVIKRILSYIKRKLPLLIASLLLSAVSVICTLSIPVFVGEAVDGMIAAGQVDFKAIIPVLIKIGVAVAGAALTQWLTGIINNRLTFGVVKDVRADAFAKIHRLPVGYVDSHGTGDTISRIMNDTSSFADGLLMGFSQFFTGIFTVILTIVLMLRINLLIAGAVIILTPISLFVSRYIAKKTHSMFSLRAKVTGEQTAFVDEMITGQKTVMAFSRQDENNSKFDEINGRLEKCTLSAVFFSSLTNPCTRFVNNLVYAAVTGVGAFTVIAGGITVGGLTTFLTYATQYTKPFNEISGVITELQNAVACAERVFEFIDAPELPNNEENTLPYPVNGEVKIKDLFFSYTPDKKLIEDFDLEIKPGMKVAIVGPTGCGKTTLINLLMRFYDPVSGNIEIDGQNTSTVTRKSLRANFGMILQDTWIKTATVRDNITIGLQNVTDDEVITAAKLSHAHNFIKRLPNGYDTVITDNEELSQGQKQLLCITRLMLRRPPMLILDEATSSIDTRTEMRIQKAFNILMEGKTSFIVAHRLSTVIHSDLIIAMKDGHIMETGTHKELLKKNGFYANLYNSQFAGANENQ